VAEQVRLADIGRKLLLVTGRELGDLLEVPHSRCCSSWSWLNRGRCLSVRRWHPCSAPNTAGIRLSREGNPRGTIPDRPTTRMRRPS
jgi:hypothetical protein